MTDSPRRRAGFQPWIAVALALIALGGCRTPGAAPIGSALERDIEYPVLLPDEADHTAAELAAFALSSDREQAIHALLQMERIDEERKAAHQLPTGLAPVSRDLVNATIADPRVYRVATRELLEDHDLDPALRGRLDLAAADDPLLLARARMWDSYMITFGHAFNSIAEPVGRSISNINMAPYRVGRALIQYAASVYAEPPLRLQERQALVHWQDYLERFPDAEEAPDLDRRVVEAQSDWLLTQRNHFLRAGNRALDRGQARLALVYATRALGFVPEDRKAGELRDRAAERIEAQRAARARSMESTDAIDVVPANSAPLVHALLLPDSDLAFEAQRLLDRDPGGPLADEAAFALATAHGEAGDDAAMWSLYEDLADDDPEETNMGRHAAALYNNPAENPYRAFLRAKRRNAIDNSLWLVFGPYYRGFPDRNLPKYISWPMEMPSVAESVMGSPMRLIQWPWMKSLPAASLAAHWGHAYLEQHPDGEHVVEVSEWVENFEKKRGNFIGAYRVAEQRPGVSVKELDDYREQAGEQALAAANRAKRRDVRLSTLRAVTQEFAGTAAGHLAGVTIRDELDAATPHRVRISRGFLIENPEAAGPRGFGIRPEILDDDPSNSELHPQGMALLGGRDVEFYYVAPSGDDKAPPLTVRETISKDRIARIVSALEEKYYENSLLDADDPVEADARRDAFFERARLGLPTDTANHPSASANFAYEGLRERYGMVRSRKSILPFDLVIKGSLTDFSFGAFPRIREPRQTPDAFLYR